ncbi:MAG: AAC(3) family N-acetyltransferase [Lachnospiraceae bacterium]|nr:AAC(3) family N-acetyltransferase [Lachnospiraceae bacterium]
MVTKQDVFKMLEDFGIKHDDKVTMHTSLKAIGEIEGGADGLIDAFCEYLSDGLFIVPTHTWANVNKENPYFNVKETIPCIGALPTVAAFRPDAKRSLHPTHSLAVFGKGAEDYIKGEDRHTTPAPVGGALSRLYEEKGKILLVGVGHEKNTYLHAVDERLNIPNRINTESFVVTITDADGNIFQSQPFHPHHTEGIDVGCSDFYPNYKKAFEVLGGVTYGKLGNALVYCCDVKRITDIVERIWKHTDHDICVKEEEIPEAYYIE